MDPNITIKEHSELYPPTPSRGKFHNIRIHARKVMKAAKIKYECNVCQYNKYVEVCHIKAIADFTPNQTINEVNSLTNLKYLCPNHHWELDHGLTQ